MEEQRVKDLGVVRRRCGSCGEVSTLELVEERSGWRWGPVWLLRRNGPVYRSVTCRSCGATYPARSTDSAAGGKHARRS